MYTNGAKIMLKIYNIEFNFKLSIENVQVYSNLGIINNCN